MDNLMQMGEEHIQALHATSTTFYADIECFIDFRLSALLCLMKGEEDYNIIKNNISVYVNRTAPSIESYFPGISITDKQVDEFLNNPTNLEAYAYYLQWTDYFDVFVDFVKGLHNKNILSGANEPIKIIIGSNDKPCPKFVVAKILGVLSNHVSGARVEVRRKGISELTTAELHKFDHFSIMDFEKTMNEPHWGKVMESGALNGVSIHAYPFVTETESTLSPDELLGNTSTLFEQLFDFNYMNMRVRHE